MQKQRHCTPGGGIIPLLFWGGGLGGSTRGDYPPLVGEGACLGKLLNPDVLWCNISEQIMASSLLDALKYVEIAGC